jgi:hypothetical protein
MFTATSCPAALGKLQDVTAPTDQGGRLINPHPRPFKAVICKYGSIFNQGAGPRHTLARQVDLTAAQAKKLASAAAHINVGASAGSASCPNDSGNATVIAFGYHNAPPVDLWWHSTGCQTIDNGATEAVQIANDSFGTFQTVFAQVTRTPPETT